MSDTRAFEAMMHAYQDMVFGTALRILGNQADAEDISQEVFLRAYERFDDLHETPTVGGWLKTVTRNLCLNHLRRHRSRWRLFSELGDGGDQGDELPQNLAVADVPATHEATDDWTLIDEALQKLPTEQRVPLVLFHLEELTYEDIASQLGVSLSKVKTDIYRGRLGLRKRLHSRRSDLGINANPPPVETAKTPTFSQTT
jgi:RNA polymerase sigma-70 factor, ECF subfamily